MVLCLASAVCVAVGSLYLHASWARHEELAQLRNATAQIAERLDSLESALSSFAQELKVANESASGSTAQITKALETLASDLVRLAANVSNLRAGLAYDGLPMEEFERLVNATLKLEGNLAMLEAGVRNLTIRLDAVQGSAETVQIRRDIEALNSAVTVLALDVAEVRQAYEQLLNQTPARVYEYAHRSVVMIRTSLGQGSGFLYDSNLILTNWHVVAGATEIQVQFYDRSRAAAMLVGVDPYSDVAVIRVPAVPPEAGSLRLGNSSGLWVGQQVVAIGNPLGLATSLSSGYISQVKKRLDLPPIIVPVLQLDIAIAPGSSGGPLLDLAGKVVGITNAGTAYGINFAVPSNIVKRVATSLVEKGEYLHPYIGVSLIELSPETIRSYNIINIDPFQTGLLVIDVVPDSPAAQAGLRAATRGRSPDGSTTYTAEDIILAVDGYATLAFEDWAAYVEEYVSCGQRVNLTVWRSGEIVSIAVTMAARPPYEG